MASHLVTVISPRSRKDLVLPGGAPMRDLIPQVVNTCVDYQHRNPNARWALSLKGNPPFAPDDTLDQKNILDGAILFLRDMTQSVVPERVAANSGANFSAPSAPPPPMIRRSGSHRYRFDLEPAAATVLTAAVGAGIFAIWVLITMAGNVSIAVGVLLAAVVVAAFLAALWWMGWLDWFGRITHINALRNFPPAPGLSPEPR
jgi:hypothetical protein